MFGDYLNNTNASSGEDTGYLLGLLSQINVLHHHDAKCANVLFDYSDNLTRAEWLMEKSRPAKVTQNACDDNNLGVTVKQLLED